MACGGFLSPHFLFSRLIGLHISMCCDSVAESYGRHDVIYVKAWYSHDNSLGQAVPGTANLANEVIGLCQG